MASIPGKSMALYVGANKVAGVTKIDGGGVDADALDTTAMGDTWETFIGGLKRGNDVSVDVNYDPTDTNGQKAIRDGVGTALSFEIRYGTTTPKVAFSGLVTGFKPSGDKSGLATASISIKPSGALTFTDS